MAMRRLLATCFALLFFGIGLFQKFAQVVQLVLPEDAVEREPVDGLLHGSHRETAHADTTGFFLLDEAGLFEDVEVLKDGGHGDAVRARQFCDGGIAPLQGGEDGSTGWVAEGSEGSVEAN